MGFLRKMAGILGFQKEDAHDEEEDAGEHHNREDKAETRRPTKGFSVQTAIPVDRPYLGPIITTCDLGDGAIQGLKWFAKRLRIDEDGDVADEFLDEVLPEVPSGMDEHKPLPKFEVKYSTRPAKVRNQVIAIDGRINQCVEFQGRLLWV